MDFEDGYLSGLTDGEGCLLIWKRSPVGTSYVMRFAIALRSDDAYLLEALRERYGGNLTWNKTFSPNANPTTRWQVQGRADVLGLIRYFDKHPLILKKAEYEIWREAALFYYRHTVAQGNSKGNKSWLVDVMEEYKAELSRLKQYGEQPRDLSVEPEVTQLELLKDEEKPMDA